MGSDLAPVSGTRLPVLWIMGVGLALLLGTAVGYRILHPDMGSPVPGPRAQAAAPAMQQEQLMAHVGALMQQVQANPEDSAALLSLTQHFIQLGQWAPAEQFGRRALALLPGQARPHYLLSVALHGLGRHEEAASSLEAALAIDEDPTLRYSLGVLYAYYLHQKDKAAAQFRKGLESTGLPEALRKDLEQELARLDAAR